jgi:hypothetical protein
MGYTWRTLSYVTSIIDEAVEDVEAVEAVEAEYR